MNPERRQAARVISNLLDALVKEINQLAEEEKAAFERRPPGSQQSPAGFDSEYAADKLEEIAFEIATANDDLWELGKPPQSPEKSPNSPSEGAQDVE